MSGQVVPSSFAQHIIVKFIKTENVKNLLIFWRGAVHSSAMKCSQGPRCMTGVSHLKKDEQLLKTQRLHLLRGKLRPALFRDSKDILFIDFPIEWRTINATYYWKLLEDLVKSAFRKKTRRSVSQKCLSPPNRRCDNRNIGNTATSRLQYWPGHRRFYPVRSTQRGSRRKTI
jgi:hypothetical protein